METTTKTKHRGPLGWMRRHKKLTALLLILILAAVIVLVMLNRAKNASTAMTYQFVRTTTLQKTDLTESVSVNGTVESGSSASVTASDSVKTYKVTAVNVAVGDTVKKGDVIATLDTSDVEKQIENAQESYDDTLTDAQKSYNQAVEDSNTKLTDLADKVTKAQEDYDTLGLTDYYSTMQNADGSTGTNRELVEYYYNLYAETVAQYENTIANLQIQVNQGVDGAAEQLQTAQDNLTVAKAQCSIPELGLQGFDTIKQYYDKIEQYKESLDQAQQNYDEAVTSNSRSVDSAATNLEKSSRTSDTLTDLQTTLDDCTLTATMDGTVTALNATVGEVCTGTVATIQNVDDLTVEVTIPTSDVSKLSTGLSCNIASDATDETVTGRLTRIDPVANSQGEFTATVTVNGGSSTGLLIGISAKVEIIISSKTDVYTVPIDAVGTADDGSSYVLRKTGGEGVDMTFEQVTVTTGDQNDYYIEISGDDLADGDVIRASADLTEGIESTNVSDDMASLFGGMGGGTSIEVTGDMPSGGGGDMPSGGGPGGNGGGPGGN